MSFIEGLFLGLGTLIFIGPVFFLILQITLAYGKLAGFYIALGILISDISYLLLFKFALYEKLSSLTNSKYLYWTFSVLLLTMGIGSFFKKKNNFKKKIQNNALVLLAKGFLINFVNPFVFVFWLGIYNYVENKFQLGKDQFSFFFAAMIGILTIDLARIFFSDYLKRKLTNSVLSKLNITIGIVFICISIYLFTQY